MITTGFKRAKDLTDRDVIKARFYYHDDTRSWVHFDGWTEILDVYVDADGYNEMSAQWDGIPKEAEKLADNLGSSLSYAVIRVAVPPISHSGEIEWHWLGFYGFDLVEVQDAPAFEQVPSERDPVTEMLQRAAAKARWEAQRRTRKETALWP